jgi:tRNA1Val (adenine37-N6)-methyltransferase
MNPAAALDAESGETLDSVAGVRILQRRDGYRFNLDAVLLAAAGLEGLETEAALRAVDLGTGSGIVALLLKRWRAAWNVTGVEVQPSLAALARRNAALNGTPLEVLEADWRSLGTPGRAGTADLVVCNPPYFAADRGQPCADAEKAAARQELNGGIDGAAKAAARLVRGNGVVRFIQAAQRLTETIHAFEQAGLGVTRLRCVHARQGEEAYAVLLEGMVGSRRRLAILPPLIVHGPDGGYTGEVDRLLRESTAGGDAIRPLPDSESSSAMPPLASAR